LGWPGARPRRPGRGYIRENGSILHVVGMGVKRIGTVYSIYLLQEIPLLGYYQMVLNSDLTGETE